MPCTSGVGISPEMGGFPENWLDGIELWHFPFSRGSPSRLPQDM